jgi:hypothetical protein
MIAIAAGALAYFLGSMIAVPLAIIPVPVFFVFGILALPLRKDQPMETYIAAMIRFWFKPHTRLWDADGQDSMVEFSNPIVDDEPTTKSFDADEAVRRLSFLADVADTQGWSTRGLSGLPLSNNLTDDFITTVDNAPDILDENDSLGQAIDNKLYQSEQQMKQVAIANMQANITSNQPHQPTSSLVQSVFQASPTPQPTQTTAVVDPNPVPTVTTPLPISAQTVQQPVITTSDDTTDDQTSDNAADISNINDNKTLVIEDTATPTESVTTPQVSESTTPQPKLDNEKNARSVTIERDNVNSANEVEQEISRDGDTDNGEVEIDLR